VNDRDARSGADGQSRSAAGERSPWLIAIVVSIATFMQVLDTSIANVALRHIAGSLAAGVDESTWVLTTYLIASAVIVPVSGWLLSVVGRKRFYMICVALFTASSLLCGLAPNLAMLIFFRVLQGLGGGGMVPSEQAILADTFPPEKRPQAFALYGIAVIVAPTIGPTLGGWSTDNWSWHWIFFINVPIGIASIALVPWLVVEPGVLVRERQQRLEGGLKVDWTGMALIALAFGCLEIVLDKGQREDWFQSNFINGFAAASVISFALFVQWELSRKDPIVDLKLLARAQFGTSFVMMMMVGASLFASTQLIPQLTQENFRYTATLSGLALMPGGVAMLCMMPIAAQTSRIIPPRYLMAFGMSVLGLAMWHLTSLTPDASFGYFAWARVYQMLGLPFLFVPITTASYAGLPPEKTNQASALINVARNLGGSIGVSMAITMLAQGAQFHQARVTEHLVPSAVPYQESLRQASAHFAAQGASQADAQRQAIGWLGQLVQAQSSLLSYIDVFWSFTIAALVLVPLALLLVSRGTQIGGTRCSSQLTEIRPPWLFASQKAAFVQRARGS
jgi:DHA2 family multidrug resistance protein